MFSLPRPRRALSDDDADATSGDLKGIKGRGGYKMKAGNGDKPIFGELEVDFQ
jgi:hypothetical protein